MSDKKSYEYILFPTAIIVGISFSYFDPIDKEYWLRNGKRKRSWFSNEYYDDWNNPSYSNSTSYKPTNNSNVQQTKTYVPSTTHNNNANKTTLFFFNSEKNKLVKETKEHYKHKKRITITLN